MTHLFACICNQPERLGQALAPVRHLLVTPGPVARWGLGFIQSGEVLIAHTPRRSSGQVDFYERLRELRTDYVIGYAAGDDGRYAADNPQPFRYRGWLFAVEPSPTEPEIEPDEPLARLVPAYLQHRMSGRTLSEYAFHVFLAKLHKDNLIDAYQLSARDVRDVLASMLESLAQVGYGDELGNVMVTNSRVLVGACLDRPLFTRRLTIDKAAQRFDAREHGFKGILVISDGSEHEPGFEPIPKRSAVVVHREIIAEVLPLDR